MAHRGILMAIMLLLPSAVAWNVDLTLEDDAPFVPGETRKATLTVSDECSAMELWPGGRIQVFPEARHDAITWAGPETMEIPHEACDAATNTVIVTADYYVTAGEALPGMMPYNATVVVRLDPLLEPKPLIYNGGDRSADIVVTASYVGGVQIVEPPRVYGGQDGGFLILHFENVGNSATTVRLVGPAGAEMEDEQLTSPLWVERRVIEEARIHFPAGLGDTLRLEFETFATTDPGGSRGPDLTLEVALEDSGFLGAPGPAPAFLLLCLAGLASLRRR